MHNRVYIKKSSLNKNDIVTLNDDESHHIVNVKRFKKNDIVELCSQSGELYKGRIENLSFPVSISILEKIEVRKDSFEIHVFFGNTKFKALESAITKCTELGVKKFIPVICDRSVSKTISINRHERLKKLVREAVKQSEQTSFMEIDFTIPTLINILKKNDWNEYDRTFLFLPDANRRLIDDKECDSLKKVALFIGPEGDFSPEEVVLFKNIGIKAYTFGEEVLRSDTAAIAAVASIKAIWG